MQLSSAWSFLKLTKRRIPIDLLIVLENWSSSGDACVKCKVWSNCFEVNFGIRQGSVLSPYLCNIYLNDRLKTIATNDHHYNADDILFIALTVLYLQSLLTPCERVTIFGRPFVKRFALCSQTVVCRVLSVT